MAGYYEGTDGEKQANKTRALNVVQFMADLAESNRRQLCDTGGAMKGMRYSTFTLNVLAGLTASPKHLPPKKPPPNCRLNC